jgi:type IV pilus assembly protein PilM
VQEAVPMLSFVQSWFAPTANPIGVDLGSDSVRLAQVEPLPDGGFNLVAAGRADVPSHVRADPAAKLAFFAEAVRDLLAQGSFRGRRAVLALPAAVMTIQHLRVAKMDDAALKQALPWECQGRLPYDPSHALLRHLVAGEVFADGEPKQEVVVMAAQRQWVESFLAAAAKAKLDVVGMNVEPKATVDCFANVYRRKSDADAVNLFVDIGCAASRAVIAKGTQILFARSVPVGGDHFTRAVAAATKAGFDDAKIMRVKLCHAQAMADLTRAAGPAGPSVRSPADVPFPPGHDGRREPEVAPDAPPTGEAATVDAACRETVARLAQELSLCRQYHDATFPSLPVTRLIFVGGEARHRSLCQQVAQAMDLAAQVGDPMARMARTTTVGPESGMDRRLPQPDWAVALGLTMGPANVPAAAAK